MDTKKILKAIEMVMILGIILFTLTGCGELKSERVTEKYVQDKFESLLKHYYGAEFIVNITSFDRDSEKREAVAKAYPKNDSSLLFEITGSIQDDYFSGSRIGSSYHTSNTFQKVLWKKVNRKLEKNSYSFEIGENADYKLVASNIRDYLKQLRILLTDYKEGSHFKNIYFNEKYQRGDIILTLNGNEIKLSVNELIIDERNGKVVTDTAAWEYGWRGELELEEYLQLMANGQLEEKINEIHNNNKTLYDNSKHQ